MRIPTLLPSEDRNIELLFSDAEIHSHFYWEFTLFTDGICKNTINGVPYTMSEGSLTVLGPSHTHSIVSMTPSHIHRDIYISTAALQALCRDLFSEAFYQRFTDPDNPVVLQLPPDFSKELEHHLSVLDAAYVQQQSKDIIDPLIRSILIFLLGQIFMSESIPHHGSVSWLSSQLAYLRQPIVFRQNIDDIIKQTGYSHSQYLRKFKQATGMPLIKYLIDLRMNHAKHLLKSTSKSVLEISSEVGYDSVNYFIRTFKNCTGVTPLQYRLQNKQQ